MQKAALDWSVAVLGYRLSGRIEFSLSGLFWGWGPQKWLEEGEEEGGVKRLMAAPE